MKLSIIILVFLTSVCNYSARCQSRFLEGIVVSNGGEERKGFISLQSGKGNPEGIFFKPSLSSEQIETLTVDHISGFTIYGYPAYRKHTVSISKNEINFDKLSEYIDTSFESKSVFLKELIRGDRVDLLSYEDAIKVRFYIHDKSSGNPAELLFRKFIRNGQEISQPMYRQQLAGLLEKYGISRSDLVKALNKSGYYTSDIGKIISAINSQVLKSNSNINKTRKAISFFVSGGLASNLSKYTGESLIMSDGLDDAGNFKFKDQIKKTSLSPRIGVGFDFFVNPITKRWLIRTELSANQIRSKTTSYYRFSIFSSTETLNTYTFSVWNLGLTPQLIYNTPINSRLSWYAGVGLNLGYLIKNKNSMSSKDKNTGTTTATNDEFLIISEFIMSAQLRSGFRMSEKSDISILWTNPVEYGDYQTGKQSLKVSTVSVVYQYKLR